jgi:hypothetical protein
MKLSPAAPSLRPRVAAFRRPAVAAAFFCALPLAGCRAYRDPEPLPGITEAPATRPGDVVVGPRFFDKKTTVRLSGRFADGVFVIARAEARDDDDEIELKGDLDLFDRAAGRGALGGVGFRVDERTRLFGEDGAVAADGEARAGRFAKAECVAEGGALRLVKLTLRERKPDESDVLAGELEAVKHAENGVFTIGGVRAVYSGATAFVFAKKDEPPPSPEARLLPAAEPGRTGPRRYVQGDEDWRPDSGLVIGDALVIGGTIEYEAEYRRNHDLRDALRRDRLIHQATAKLELSADLGRHAFVYGALRTTYDAVHFDQESDEPSYEDTSLEALFVQIQDVPFEGFALQIGRQRFEEGREWVVRRDYDAVRAKLRTSAVEFEFSIGRKLSDADLEDGGVVNTLAAARAELLPGQELYAYLLHRRHGDFIDLDRKHYGVSLEGEIGDFAYWAEAAAVDGLEGGLPVAGFGFDVAAMYVLKDLPLEPSVYAGFAAGEGDGDLSDGVDDTFRQTGLQRNNDRFHGVAGFRYYGTLFRPELSNMEIATFGVGVRPSARSSVDLLFHAYRQDVAFPVLRASRLRYEPNGIDPDLGTAVDLVIGLEDWRPWEFEIDLGWFGPGGAFDGASDAWYLLFQAKYSF